MTRKIRNCVILAKRETTPGVDAAPSGAANAILIAEMSIDPLVADNIERKNIRGSFGASAELVGTANVKVSITVELAGSGSAATAPQWGQLLLGCAMAEGLLTTPDRVEYTPVSLGLQTLTIYYYDDGVLHKLLGAQGDCTLMAKVGEIPKLQFDITGVDGTATATPNVTADYTAWKPPVAMTKANVVDIAFGATYAAGAFAGGVSYPSNGLEIKFGNEVNFNANLTNESIDVTDRSMSGSVELQLDAAQEVAMLNKVKINELQSLAFQIGLASGKRILIHAPSVQLNNPKKIDVKGVRYCGYDARFLPVNGNDELRLACT
jgi:hypothetical protein